MKLSSAFRGLSVPAVRNGSRQQLVVHVDIALAVPDLKSTHNQERGLSVCVQELRSSCREVVKMVVSHSVLEDGASKSRLETRTGSRAGAEHLCVDRKVLMLFGGADISSLTNTHNLCRHLWL